MALAVDLAMAAAKGLYGYFTGSLGMAADGLHSLMHASAGVIGLIGVHLATRPPDPGHPYGYERYEPLAAMGIAGVMLLSVMRILESAVTRLKSGSAPAVTLASFGIMIGATLLTVVLAAWERHRSRALGSTILRADAARVWSDTLVSVSVIAGLVATLLGAPKVDAFVSVAVAVIIAWTAWSIVRGASRVLTDSSVGDVERIAEVARGVEGVKGCHQVRARGVAGSVRVDLHITVDPQMTVGQSHRVAEEVERLVKAEMGGIAEVLVHIGAATMH